VARAFTYKNGQINPKILGKELGIRWAVQGAVRRNGNQLRVNISLTDLSTGLDVWSDRFDGDRENILAIQDQITARLVRSLNVELIYAESHRSEKSKNPDAMDFNMRGWAKFYEPRSKAQIAKAKEMFEAALQIDPENVDATIGEAWCLMQDVTGGFSSSPVNDQRKATDLINKVLPKNPANVWAHVVKGDTLRYGHPEESLAEYNAVLDIDPNFAVAYGLKGTALTVAGRVRETFSAVELALRLSPKDPFASGWHYYLCHAHVHLLAELYRIRPDFTVQWYRQLGYGYSSNPQFRRELDDILDGLRKGGVREQ
jgi:adenylate cyclase